MGGWRHRRPGVDGQPVTEAEIRSYLKARKAGREIYTQAVCAVWGDRVKIVMDDEQTIRVCTLLPDSIVIATHMDSVDHATVSRKMLREYARDNGVQDRQLLIPEDGEVISVLS